MKPHPVVGIVYHCGQNESGEEHSHNMYLVSWDGQNVHVHQFSGITSYDVGHRHRYIGRTEPAPSGVQHIHAYYTVTSFDDGHEHIIKGRTGPAVPIPGGGHIHFFEGYTTVNGRPPHSHYYSGKTTV
ncbi:YmaF family protein [Ammoniphilus sp. 3BR4]|uniref:YmaF family protein n=1 Tax=Ammoniphilus sp. 3BR4 TaxID=3158265 RepID=UPI00346620D9